MMRKATGTTLRVAMAQIAPVWLDRTVNVVKMVVAISSAGDQGAGLVVFRRRPVAWPTPEE